MNLFRHGKFKHKHNRRGHRRCARDGAVLNLACVPPGNFARLIGYTQQLPTEKQARLRAVGLLPGDEVLVIQHDPVTILRCGEMEIALENDLASAMLVQFQAEPDPVVI